MRRAMSVDRDNVCGVVGAFLPYYLLCSYDKVVMLGKTTDSLENGDFPMLPSNLRASCLFATMKKAICAVRWCFKCW